MRYKKNYLGRNLLYLRKLKKLTQRQMEQHLDIGRASWSNYELGITSPSLDSLINIARFFNVSVNELVLEDLEPAGTDTELRPFYSNDTIVVISAGEFYFLKNEMERLLEEVENITKTYNSL